MYDVVSVSGEIYEQSIRVAIEYSRISASPKKCLVPPLLSVVAASAIRTRIPLPTREVGSVPHRRLFAVI